MLTDEEIDQKATEFASHVSVSRRVAIDMYLGSTSYNTVTDIVKAAFVAGAKVARAISNDPR